MLQLVHLAYLWSILIEEEESIKIATLVYKIQQTTTNVEIRSDVYKTKSAHTFVDKCSNTLFLCGNQTVPSVLSICL